MRIIQLIQKPQLRGAEIFACQLSNHLVASGHEVLLISLFSGDAALPFKGKHIALNRPTRIRLFDFNGWRELGRHVREFAPDIIQANAGDTLKFAVISRMLYSWNARIIFRNANKVSDFVDSWLKREFNKFLLRRTDHVISVSELCRLDIVATYQLDAGKTTTVPIGVEEQLLSSMAPSDLTSVLSIGKVLVHVASFVPEKNHVGLLRIAKRLIDEGEQITVLLIGSGPLQSWVKKQINEMKLDGRVLVLGSRNDVFSIISKATCLVQPSKIEGFPAVILEAMYCSTPVVAYDVGGIGEIVKPGVTGWLVPSGDESGFASAVRETWQGGIDDIINNAHSLVTSEYNNRRISQRFLAAYDSVVSKN